MTRTDLTKIVLRSILTDNTRVEVNYKNNGRKPQHVRLVALSDHEELLAKGMFRVALFGDIDMFDKTRKVYFTRIFNMDAIHSIIETKLK